MFSPERYAAAHEGAVVLEPNDRGRIRVTGADRLTYLQGLLTNDVAALTRGTGCYAALLTPQGRMVSDMRVFETGDAALLDVPAAVAERVARHLADFVFTEDAHVENVTTALAHLVVLGPASSKASSVGALRPFENRPAIVAETELIAAGNDDFGVPAVDLFVPREHKAGVLAHLQEHGVTSIDNEVAEILRIEAGRPKFGIDMDHDTIPLEAGIEDRAISLTKGCYVGQEVIIRVLHRGHGRVARKLVGLVFPPDGVPPIPGEKLQAGEREIGTVTSAASSPALARPIALGYVHRDFTSPGTRVNDATGQSATVTPLPFTVPATQ